MDYLREAAPWGVKVDVTRVKASDAFKAPKGGRAMAAATEALGAAYDKPVSEVGSGGSIPLLETRLRALSASIFSKKIPKKPSSASTSK